MIRIDPNKPVLIAGPTASGKSALALHIARSQGGVIINADSLQVYQGWSILTAQPTQHDKDLAPHALYGHQPFDADYSVGHWIADVEKILKTQNLRPIIIGGTGLYFHALNHGLSPIPHIPDEVRAHANTLTVEEMCADLDTETLSSLDQQNPRRVQRAWEVQTYTKRSLKEWHQIKGTPLLDEAACHCLCLDAPKQWLTPRIEQRFDLMIKAGVLKEAEAMCEYWNPDLPSSKAIGAPWIIEHLLGRMSKTDLKERTTIATRQYAKRQRTWFRARLHHWHWLSCDNDRLEEKITLR